jgi:hypothetical protein
MKGIPQLCTIHACENPSPLADDRYDNLNDAAAQHSILHNEAQHSIVHTEVLESGGGFQDRTGAAGAMTVTTKPQTLAKWRQDFVF